MSEKNRTKDQLIAEIAKLRSRVAELEDCETKRKQVEVRITQNRENLEKMVQDRTAELTKSNENLAREIEERKQVEKALRKSEEQYRLLADNASDVIWTMDLDLNFTYVSPSIEEMFGYSVEQALSNRLEDIMPPESLKTILDRIQEEVSNSDGIGLVSKPFSLDVQQYRNDGSLFWTVVNIILISQPASGTYYLQGVTRDITERKQRKEHLKTSKKLLQDVMDLVPNFICAKNLEGKFILVNKKLTDFYGTTVAEMTGKLHADLCEDKNELQAMLAADRKVMKSGKPEYIPEETMQNPDGSISILETYKIPFTANDEPAVLIASTDITKRKQAEEDIRKFRSISDNAVHGNAIVDLQGNIVYINKYFAQIHGYTCEELIGRNLSIFHTEKQLGPVVEINESLMKNGSYNSMEVWHVHKDGTEFPMLMSGIRINDEKGVPIHMAATAIDITRHKQAEDALYQRVKYEQCAAKCIKILAESDDIHSRLSRVLDVIRDIVDVSRVYIFKNEDDPELGLCMTQIHESCASDQVPQINNPELQHLPYETGAPSMLPLLLNRIPYRHIIAEMDGPEREILESQNILSILIMPIFTGEKLWGFFGFDDCTIERRWQDDDLEILQTITDATGTAILKWQAEEALALEREQLLSIFDSIDEFIYISDPYTYELLYANQRFKDTFHEDVVGGLCYRELQGLDSPCEFCTNKIILNNDHAPYRWEYHNSSLGQDFAIIDRIIKWPDGRDVRFELATDITDRKLAEAQKDDLEAQLHQSQKIESVGRLAGGVAHDFNNLLTVILGYAEMLRSALDSNDPMFGDVEEIVKAGESASRLTTQLLAFSRKQTINPKVVDINQSVGQSQKMLKRLIEEDINLVFIPDNDLWKTKVDPGQLDQVLVNLTVNARDAMPDGGDLTIETANVAIGHEINLIGREGMFGDFVMLSVTDTGSGMEKHVLENIFEPFFTTKGKGKGTGLGLSTVYGIVRQHDGFIYADSEPGKGTSFKIYLPRVLNELEEIAGPATVSSIAGTETVLLAEDEDMVRRLAKRILTKNGYNVLEAAQGGDAFLECEKYEGDIHLLLTDVIMPKMSGKELYDRIKPLRPGIKVLFMSGYTDDAIAHRGVLDKDTPFIQKPFKADDLLQKVLEVLGKKP